MEQYFAIFVSPDKPDRQSPAQLATSGFVADTTVQAGPQDMELGFTHGALEAEDQAIIELGGMIDPVVIADQGISDATEIE